MCNVAVLLAAYNGMSWIDEQIQSILNQKKVNVDIYISVDVSTDGTEIFCSELSKKNKNIILLPYGEKFGDAASNFYHLIKNVAVENYDYISFADQDDIWHEDKLFKATSKLSTGEFSGYSSDVLAFWKDGRTKVVRKSQMQVTYDYLFESSGPGCTFVINNSIAIKLREILINVSETKQIQSHDWFVYALVRSSECKWYIDDFLSMKYRQHDRNQVGVNSGWRTACKRISMIKNGWYRTQIIKIADVLDLKDDIVTKGIAKKGFLSRLILIRNGNKLRRKVSERIFLLIMIFFGVF